MIRNQQLFFIKMKKTITGTTRLIFDSENKLPTDKIFSFDAIRKKYNKIGELSMINS